MREEIKSGKELPFVGVAVKRKEKESSCLVYTCWRLGRGSYRYVYLPVTITSAEANKTAGFILQCDTLRLARVN